MILINAERSVGFNTASALVHELLEARDEKRLLRLQRQLAGYKLLIIDELGYRSLQELFLNKLNKMESSIKCQDVVSGL